MVKRRHYFIVGGILLVGLIFGSFFDLQISAAISDSKNGFGVFLGAFGMVPGLSFVAFLSGVLFYHARKNISKTWLKVLLIIASILGIGAASYFGGSDVFSVNGFNYQFASKPVVIMVSVLIGLVFASGFFVLGNWLGRNFKSKKTWIVCLILLIAFALTLLGANETVKNIFHRPRFRYAIKIHGDDIPFHNWWEPCSNYSSYLEQFSDLTKEEFKSFPSGHTGVSMYVAFFLSFLSLCVPKLKKHSLLLFYSGFAFALLIGFSRILVAAHFLSDVCFGGLIALIFMFTSNEFIRGFKLLEEKPKEVCEPERSI